MEGKDDGTSEERTTNGHTRTQRQSTQRTGEQNKRILRVVEASRALSSAVLPLLRRTAGRKRIYRKVVCAPVPEPGGSGERCRAQDSAKPRGANVVMAALPVHDAAAHRAEAITPSVLRAEIPVLRPICVPTLFPPLAVRWRRRSVAQPAARSPTRSSSATRSPLQAGWLALGPSRSVQRCSCSAALDCCCSGDSTRSICFSPSRAEPDRSPALPCPPPPSVPSVSCAEMHPMGGDHSRPEETGQEPQRERD